MAQAPSTESRDRVRGTVPKLIDLSEKGTVRRRVGTPAAFQARPQPDRLRDADRHLSAGAVARPSATRAGQRRHQGGTVRGDHPSCLLCRLACCDDGGEHRPRGVRGQPVTGARHAGGIHRPRHHGCQHGRELAKGTEGARRHAGGARHPPRGRLASFAGRCDLGGLAAGSGGAERGDLHLAPRPAGIRGGGGGIAGRDPEGHCVFRPDHQLADRGAQGARGVRRQGRAICSMRR